MRPAFFLFLLTVVSFGQVIPQKATANKDAIAVSVIQSSLAAMGAGNTANPSAVLQATVSYPDGSSASVSSKSMGFDRVRHEFSKDGKSSVHVVNSGDGYTQMNGKTRHLPLWDASRGQEYIPAFSRITDYQNANLGVVYVGLESINDQKVHHIKLFAPSSDPASSDIDEVMSTLHVFIDAQSLMVVKIQTFDFSTETPTNRSLVEISFDSYKSVSGVAVPFHSVRTVARQKYCETTLQSVTLNAPVTAADFQ